VHALDRAATVTGTMQHNLSKTAKNGRKVFSKTIITRYLYIKPKLMDITQGPQGKHFLKSEVE
jgi:hypothetical protein